MLGPVEWGGAGARVELESQEEFFLTPKKTGQNQGSRSRRRRATGRLSDDGVVVVAE